MFIAYTSCYILFRKKNEKEVRSTEISLEIKAEIPQIYYNQ